MEDDESREDPEDINEEFEADATRVTWTAAEKKSLLDIIPDITVKGSVSAKPTPVAPHQTLIKFPAVTPKKSSKRK